MEIVGAVIVAMNKAKTHVLMIERKDPIDMFGLIGGGVEEGESSRDAAVREFAEETGIALPHQDVTWLVRSEDDFGNLVDAYRYTKPLEIEDFVGPEGLEVKWVPVKEISDPAITPWPAFNTLVQQALALHR